MLATSVCFKPLNLDFGIYLGFGAYDLVLMVWPFAIGGVMLILKEVDPFFFRSSSGCSVDRPLKDPATK